MKNLGKVFLGMLIILISGLTSFGQTTTSGLDTTLEIDIMHGNLGTYLTTDADSLVQGDTIFRVSTYYISNSDQSHVTLALLQAVVVSVSDRVYVKFELYNNYFNTNLYRYDGSGYNDTLLNEDDNISAPTTINGIEYYSSITIDYAFSFSELGESETFNLFLHDNYYTYFDFTLEFEGTPTISGISPIFNSNKPEINIYPNPVVNTLNISGGEETRIFDLTGRLLLQTTDKTIDVSNFNRGTYIVNVDGVSRKIEIKK